MRAIRVAWCGMLAAALAGCGGSGSGSAVSTPPTSTAASTAAAAAASAPSSASASSSTTAASGSATGTPAPSSHAQATVALLLAAGGASRNWAKVAIRILTVALTPQNGAAPVTVYAAPASAPPINLEQLDHISQLLGSMTLPPGTYTGAVVTVAANPGDVALTSSDDPSSGFAGPLSSPIPAQNIKVQDTKGGAGAMTVSIPVPLAAPYVASATTPAQPPLRLDFALSSPSFLQSQTPASNDPTLWAVNFQGPVTGQSIADITSLVLRQMYGTLSAVASDGTSLTITRDYPAQPVANPETAVATPQQLTVLADSGNGTAFYDLDAGTSMTVSNFAALAGLSAGRYLRIAARYQSDGSLVATQIWASDAFATVWSGPEGHVTRVDAGDGTLEVEDASGKPVTVQTDSSTEFDYHGMPIATGSAFLASGHIVRGFKVHVSPRDPGAKPLLARSIDIESAQYQGAISNTSLTGLTYTSQFPQSADNYTLALDYISPSSPNGTAANGAPIMGYAYWNFAFPTEVVYGDSAAADFQLATSGGLTAYGVSLATWDDPAAPGAWALRSTTLLPAPLGLAQVTTGLTGSGYTSSFSLTPLGGGTPVTVQLVTAPGSAPLVYQTRRDHGNVTMIPLDITTSSGLAQLTAALQPGTFVNVFALPKSSGVVQAYTLLYYTGIEPREAAPSRGSGCDGTYTGVFDGTVTVGPGQDCVLSDGATVTGDIQVTGGTLELAGARVTGNVQARGGGTVSVLQSTLIEGNLRIQNLPADSPPSRVCGATIQGNVQYQDNAAAIAIGGGSECPGNSIRGNVQDMGNTAATQVVDNMIGGNLQVQGNTGSATQISGNVVGRNLQCENNTALSGGGNTARTKQGQCASL